jgi:hypothetical protein
MSNEAHPSPTFVFDEADIPFIPGQSVGAALTAAGVRSWRSTRRKGSPRGLFCGIGICFDCLIIADDRPNQRACLLPAREHMHVTTQEGTGHGHLAI